MSLNLRIGNFHLTKLRSTRNKYQSANSSINGLPRDTQLEMQSLKESRLTIAEVSLTKSKEIKFSKGNIPLLRIEISQVPQNDQEYKLLPTISHEGICIPSELIGLTLRNKSSGRDIVIGEHLSQLPFAKSGSIKMGASFRTIQLLQTTKERGGNQERIILEIGRQDDGSFLFLHDLNYSLPGIEASVIKSKQDFRQVKDSSSASIATKRQSTQPLPHKATEQSPAPRSKGATKPTQTALQGGASLRSIWRQLRFWDSSAQVVPTLGSPATQTFEPVSDLQQALLGLSQRAQAAKFVPWVTSDPTAFEEAKGFLKKGDFKDLQFFREESGKKSSLAYLQPALKQPALILINHPSSADLLASFLHENKDKRIYIPLTTAADSFRILLNQLKTNPSLHRIVSFHVRSGHGIVQSREGLGFVKFSPEDGLQLFPNKIPLGTIIATPGKTVTSQILREAFRSQALALGFQHNVVSKFLDELPPLAFAFVNGMMRIHTNYSQFFEQQSDLFKVLPNLKDIKLHRGIQSRFYSPTIQGDLDCCFELPLDKLGFHFQRGNELQPFFRIKSLGENLVAIPSINFFDKLYRPTLGEPAPPQTDHLPRRNSSPSASFIHDTETEKALRTAENTTFIDPLEKSEESSPKTPKTERHSSEELDEFLTQEMTPLLDDPTTPP